MKLELKQNGYFYDLSGEEGKVTSIPRKIISDSSCYDMSTNWIYRCQHEVDIHYKRHFAGQDLSTMTV